MEIDFSIHSKKVCHVSTMEIPSQQNFSGFLNFEVELAPIRVRQTRAFLYSEALNKIYIRAGQALPLQFRVAPHSFEQELVVRAVVVFTDHDSITLPVLRCSVHQQQGERDEFNFCKDFKYSDHIVGCSHRSAEYEINPVSLRRSVTIRLPRYTGTDSIWEEASYYFMCFTSCMGGIDRRPVVLILTLELNEVVQGRKVFCMRVCGSPRRDFMVDDNRLRQAGVDKNQVPDLYGPRMIIPVSNEADLVQLVTEAKRLAEELLPAGDKKKKELQRLTSILNKHVK